MTETFNNMIIWSKGNGIFQVQTDSSILEKQVQTYQSINEESYKQLLKMSDRERKNKAKLLTTEYRGVTDKKGWIRFRTKSQRIPTKYYNQYIFLSDSNDMKYFKEFRQQDIIRLFLSGNIKIFCDCPDFQYRMKYLAYHKGFGLRKETRKSSNTNPQLEGALCKHLIVVLSVIGANWSSIAHDMRRTKYFKDKMEEETENITQSRNTKKKR